MAMQMEIDERAINNVLLEPNEMWTSSTESLLALIANTPDVNITNGNGNTPLHLAVQLRTIDVALELIKRGADIDAIGEYGHTPLHRAVIYNNRLSVCLLLYYNADVTLVCESNLMAVMYAGNAAQINIARTLLHYHEDGDFPLGNNGSNILLIFAEGKSPAAIDLVKMGVDVNSVNLFDNYSPITYSIRYKKPKLFKMLWTRIDYNILLYTFKPFLFIYATQNNFPINDKIECLNLILKSDIAFDLIREAVCFTEDFPIDTFLGPFLNDLQWHYCKASATKNLIQIFLSYGAEVIFADVDHAVCAGFVGIASLLSYYSSTKPVDLAPILKETNVLSKFLSLTDTKKDYRPKSISKLLRTQLILGICFCMETNIRYVMGFFSLPRDYKHHLLGDLQRKGFASAIERLEALPEFPTLLEICRNNMRLLLLNGIKKSYEFYDAVERLPIPNDLKSILCFKTRLH